MAGEAAAAFVVVDDHYPRDAGKIRRWVRERLADYASPLGPPRPRPSRNATGTVLKGELCRQAEELPERAPR